MWGSREWGVRGRWRGRSGMQACRHAGLQACRLAGMQACRHAGIFTSIFILFYFMRSLSMSFYFIIKTSSRFNGCYLCFWLLSLFSFIWIGGQFPVDNFLSYGRILTLH